MTGNHCFQNPIQSNQEKILNKLRELFPQIQWPVAPTPFLILFCTAKGQHVPKREPNQELSRMTFSRLVAYTNQTDIPEPYLISSIHTASSKIKKKKNSFDLYNTLEIDRRINDLWYSQQISPSPAVPFCHVVWQRAAIIWQRGNTELLWHLLVTNSTTITALGTSTMRTDQRLALNFSSKHHARCSGRTKQERSHCKPSASHPCHRPLLN